MMDKAPTATLTAVPNFPMVASGDDLGAMIIGALEAADMKLRRKDVLVVAQKIVSKAEGRVIDLNQVEISARARDLATLVDKDARLVELILAESEEVVAHRPGVLVVAHKLGYVMANAGIDHSNVPGAGSGDFVLLLPEDPDSAAATLKSDIDAHCGTEVAVVVSDTVGRAWRNGAVGMALGCAGLPAVKNMVGRRDMAGRPLEITETGFADEIASAASLLMGQADEGRPVILVRGLDWDGAPSDGRALLRPKNQDLFR